MKLKKEILKDETIDGIYHAIGIHFYNETQENVNFFKNKLTTLNGKVNAFELPYVLINAHPKVQGHFSIDGFTVRKSKIENVGYFNEKLRLHQDTDLCMKLALTSNLITGNINEAVALRGVHENNRISKSNQNYDSKILLYKTHLEWSIKNQISPQYIEELVVLLDCFNFLNSASHSIFRTILFTIKNKAIFFRNRRFNMLISKANASEAIKRIIIRIKEKIVILFFKKQLEKIF